MSINQTLNGFDNQTGSPIWTCLVCNHSLQDLYVLPCYHRFCDGCLHHWLGIYITKYGGSVGQYPCQLCWCLYKIPEEGTAVFKQNYYVMQLQGQLASLAMSPGEVTAPPSGDINMNPETLTPEDTSEVNMENVNANVKHQAMNSDHMNTGVRSAAHSCMMYGPFSHFF